MAQRALVSIIAGSPLLRAGLERVIARAGLDLADTAPNASILLRVRSPETQTPLSEPGDPTPGYDAELVVVGTDVDLRIRQTASAATTTAAWRLLEQLRS